MKKVLIVDDMHPNIIGMLADLGYEADYQPEIGTEQILQIIPYYCGLFVRSKIKIDAQFLERAILLQFIARAGAGLDKIDTLAVEAKGIALINAPEGNRDAVAEHVIGMLLGLMNKLFKANLEVKQGIWEREANRGVELGSKTVAIIGFGHTGSSLAKKLRGFDCEILAYDVHPKLSYPDYVQKAPLDLIFAKADVVSFHVPLTKETKWMVDEEYLSKFSKAIWIANASRGEILVTDDLIRAINRGWVMGAALDVLEIEKLARFEKEKPLVYKRLMDHPQIILSPHIAGWTLESYVKINQVLIQKLKALRFHDC